MGAMYAGEKMTDDELLTNTLDWVASHFSYELTEKGWESPRQLWEHILTCDLCDIFGDCPYIEQNPDKPVHGPPLPREFWKPLDPMLYDAYMPALQYAVDDSIKFVAGYEQVTRQMADNT